MKKAKMAIEDDQGNNVLTLFDTEMVENTKNGGEGEYKVTGQLSIKELILFFLWSLQKSTIEPEEMRQRAEESGSIIDKLVERIWFESTDSTKLPSVRYDLVDVSRLDIKMERNGAVVDIPDRSDLTEYFNYFHTLVQERLQSEPVASVLSSCLKSYIDDEAKKTTKKENRKKGGNKREPKLSGDKLRGGNFKMGIHGLQQAFGNQKQLPIFNEAIPSTWEGNYGTSVNNDIDRYGIDLTDLQFKVMEGVIMGLSQTKYEGNIPPKTKKDLLEEFKKVTDVEKLPRIYQNIDKIPRLRIQQRELMRLCGIENDDQKEYARGLEAFEYLSKTQFCFYYTRLAYDSKGQPEKDPKTNAYKKERVEAIDTLIKVKTIRDEATNEFKFYEIEPSAIFLDQKERYFLLIPYDWREEVKKVVGGKKASSYTMRFLLYLRYQYEARRRSNSNKRKGATQSPYEIKASWTEIAIALKMPESVYKGQKDRAIKIIDQAYQVALKLEYLSSYTREGYQDILIFNPSKYPKTEEEKLPERVKA